MNYNCTFSSASPASSTSSSPSSPISIGWPSPSGSFSTTSSRGTSSSDTLSANCAFPSWSFFNSSAPSSYISDADLFPDDLLDSAPLMDEAPAPPRQYPLPTAAPLLPLYASHKPKKRRRSSGKKRHPSKPMTPIAESPLAAPE